MTDAPDRPQPELAAEVGPWGGPVYSYRGAEIRCPKGGHVCGLLMEGHPPHGMTFGVVGTVTRLVDLWMEERRLPDHSAGRLTLSGSSGKSCGLRHERDAGLTAWPMPASSTPEEREAERVPVCRCPRHS